ncbi:HupE/UreJ family protein [Aquincola sp. MAHUQ-54]|uniref:HupE/UreJ family protein n=1 Tax=Aquincola agrisoli TaxID=3119538 RepID=A0AAW9QA61_9BURK
MSSTLRVVVCTLLAVAAGPVLAHSVEGVGGGFAAGFLHPLLGPDHVAAMVAVGLWGAFLGQPALWVLPVVFPLVMTVGGALGLLGVPLPGVEIGIALSAVLLGAMVALAVRPPLWVAGAIVGVFAVFHGHAHGTELPHAANPIVYSLGFVVSTGLLHLGGIGLGALVRSSAGRVAVRACGAAIALAGLVFLRAAL